MEKIRGQFSSRMGFILAAAGSAVGLGNIWGFPTQVANNGGAAFLVTYLVLAFCLAYPALMAELTIGRHTRANIVTALQVIAGRQSTRRFGQYAGIYGVVTASLILSFYTLVAGWVLAHFAAHLSQLLGINSPVPWLTGNSLTRNLLFALLFALMTIAVIAAGVHRGIEVWSDRLMPALLVLLLLLIGYVLCQDGAMAGLRVYLIPDFARINDPQLILSAMGQAFFSLSLGVGTMLIYGSYMRPEDNLPAIGAQVTLVDTGIAFLAGLLVIPAMFVARHQGIEIYDQGQLAGGPTLIFRVLPELFNAAGLPGQVMATAFFALLTIAALTSSISMLEVPVSLTLETTALRRPVASWIIGLGIFALTSIITINFDRLFGIVVALTTTYSEPLVGIVLCIYAGWIWNRNSMLNSLRQGNPEIEDSFFWKVWPGYVRYICPFLIFALLVQSLRA